MVDLSLHILDVATNAFKAKATFRHFDGSGAEVFPAGVCVHERRLQVH